MLKILVSVSLLAWMFSTIEWSVIRSALLDFHLGWMLAVLGSVIASVAVSVVKWGFILKASKLDLSYRILWRSYWAGLFFNNFLPSSIGGDGLRIYWIGKHTNDLPGATTSVVVERVLATMGLCLTALIAALFASVNIQGLELFFFFILLGSTLILMLILFPKLTDRVHRFFIKWPKAQKFILGLSQHGARLRNEPMLLAKALVWSVVFQLCVVMVNWCIFQGLSAGVSFKAAAYLIPATSVAAMLPVGVNGYGLREGAYMTLFATVGIPSGIAITASILFALLVSFTSLWGGWIWMREGRQINE